jgi:hypothetical protein
MPPFRWMRAAAQAAGDKVKLVAMDGLKLRVEKA